MRLFSLSALVALLVSCKGTEGEIEFPEVDADGDGLLAEDDCDDSDAAVGAAPASYPDADQDGYGDPDNAVWDCVLAAGHVTDASDCNDTDAAYHPGAPEDDCEDPNDYNCDGSVGTSDLDGDGWAACLECQDGDPAVHPDAVEMCNDKDDDCDGSVDEAGALGGATWYLDADGDGWGVAGTTVTACDAPEGYAARSGDCNDATALVSPGAAEVCDPDNTDEDCDGLADDADVVGGVSGRPMWYLDLDRDGYGASEFSVSACDAPRGYVASSNDCDDDDRYVNPGAVEVCDSANVDEDCDGLEDDDDDSVSGSVGTWYADADADSYGDIDTSFTGCDLPRDYVTDSTDCDPDDGRIHPGAVEACDGIDNDCDTRVDEVLSCGGEVLVEFGHCGASGYGGPTQDQCDLSYSGTELEGGVTVTAGVQTWTVPADGDYRIEAWGAIGASGDSRYVGGSGAYASGVFALFEGDVLTIVVGQKGLGQSSGTNGGGGGGSFVVDASDTPMVIAGGGGGTRTDVAQNGCHGRSDTSGGTGSASATTNVCAASRDTIGGGGAVSASTWGSGGGGYNTAGTSDTGGDGGSSFLAGAEGGNASASGGFGSGGSGNGGYGGGGGGGYTGGQGGRVAGGGGSYVGASAGSATRTAGVNADHGAVTIERI